VLETAPCCPRRRRYAIVDTAMHQEAAAKLDAWAADQAGKADAARQGQVHGFAQRAGAKC